MAIVVDIISEFSDKGLRTAKGAFNDFKTRVGAAEGAMGKFKAGSTAAMDIVKANAGTFALGAGAAMATFAAHAVTAFQDLALEAGKFSSATGLAVDDASRWLEVAGDLGIDAGNIETAIGKMNKELGSNPGLLKSLGDDVIYAKDGTINANDTFLKLVDRLKGIKDPTERAKEASKLFGKSWQNVAQIIDIGSGDIKRRLGEVADTKVNNQDELDKARKFRDSMDDLKDKAEELGLKLGEALIPVLSQIIDMVNKLAGFFGWLADGVKGDVKVMNDSMNQFFHDLGWSGGGGQARKDFEDLALSMWDNSVVVHDAFHTNIIPSVDDTTTALEDLQTQWDDLTSDIEGDIALRNMEIELGNVKDAAAKAFGGTQEDLLNYRNEIDQARLKLIELGQGLDLQDQRTLKIYVDKSDLEGAVGYLKAIGALGTGFGGEKVNQFGRIVAGARAGGGPVMAGGSYLVGENGPEIFTPSSSGSITPNGAIGGANITVNVSGADPNAVVRALQQYVRQSGPVPVNTRAM